MLLERQRFASWIRDYLQKRYPELVAPLLRALEAFDRAESSGKLSSADLAALTEASRSKRSPLSENVAPLLGYLARRFECAQETIYKMSIEPQAHIRVYALVALEGVGPCEFRDSVVRKALRDLSARVRKLAGDKIRGWNMTQVIPDLEAAIVRESKPAVREALEWQCNLLRDGYSLRKETDGRVWITFQRDTGATIGTFVAAEEISEKGVAAIARRLGVDLTRRLSKC